jgi:cysteine synthase
MIGAELRVQFPGDLDAFCGAFRTAGMIMATSRILKAKWPETRIVALEPTSSPLLRKGHAGPHGVEGIGAGRVPPHLDSNLYDEARRISEEDMPYVDDLLGKKECWLGLQRVRMSFLLLLLRRS